MKKKYIVLVGCVVVVLAAAWPVTLHAKRSDGQDAPPAITPLEPFTKTDRVLILAPHPDDESIGTGGVVQKALQAGADLHVAYLTNGEHNQLSFIVFEKRLVIKQKALIEMGKVREQEGIAAMKFLGLPRESLTFFGYPDFGTMQLFLRYWGNVVAFRNMITRVPFVPYESALSPGAPYKGESVLADLTTVLKKYRPTKIFVSSPADTNRDHRALNLFLQVALWDLQDELPPPAVYSYLIHCYGWPRPSNYHPDLYLHIPKKFARSQVQWRTLDLSPEEEELKHQAIRLYRSQCSDSAFYLVSFARKNELFGRYPDIELEKANGSRDFEIATTYEDKTVAYCRMEGNLFINVFLRREGVGFRRLFVNIAGYRRGVAFARMPKLKIIVSPLGVKLLDRGKFIDARCISVEEKKHSMSIRVPLAALGDPSYLLSSVNTYREDYSTDLNAWRVIKLK